VRPIPVVFHIWKLQIHTYGIGLAITFWVAYRYFDRRLRKWGYPTSWLTGAFVWIIVAAVVGARFMHVVSNWSAYAPDPIQVFAIWQGGLSSFGGLLFAIPTGLVVAHRRCPELHLIDALDLVSPVLMAGWALGRLLGPQLMVRGGGHPTTAWFGMYYADQVGKRLPVPIFQAFDSFVIFLVLLWIERHLAERPKGFVLAVTACLWGLARYLEEHLWLSYPGHLGSALVQDTGLALCGAGLLAAVALWLNRRRLPTAPAPLPTQQRGEGDVEGTEPAPSTLPLGGEAAAR
jgi:phosphatidylglycerol:prolipoprotein diacylglycerol transferase